jgi:hypothetical protein
MSIFSPSEEAAKINARTHKSDVLMQGRDARLSLEADIGTACRKYLDWANTGRCAAIAQALSVV